MASTYIRDLHDDDLDGIVHLWDEVSGDASQPVYSLAEVIASCQEDHAVVAMSEDRLVGAAVGRAAHAQGWIVFFATEQGFSTEQVGADLLDALERRMAPLGLSKLSVLFQDGDQRFEGLEANGFELRHRLRYLERQMPVQRRELDLLKEVGGRILSRNL